MRALRLALAALAMVATDACDTRMVPRGGQCAADGTECRVGKYCMASCLPVDTEGRCVGLSEGELERMRMDTRPPKGMPDVPRVGWAPARPIRPGSPLPIVRGA